MNEEVEQMMKTVLVVSYYGPNSPICYAENALKENGWIVADFPMFRFKQDVHDKVENYLELFFASIRENLPDLILFWYTGMDETDFFKTKMFCQTLGQKEPKIMLYTWDDPYNWRTKESNVPNFSKFLDSALTCCSKSIQNYVQANTKCVARLLYPGFDEKIANEMTKKHEGANRFVCDVSFLCTNLYNDEKMFPDQRIRRIDLLDAIENDSSIVFHLYGPSFLKERYPKSYRGFVEYEVQYEIARTSRVCLSTHVISNESDIDYLNERSIIVLGCGGLLLTDNQINTDCKAFVQMGEDVNTTMLILRQLIALDYIYAEKIRNNAQSLALSRFTWNCWAKEVEETYKLLSAKADV